MAGGNGTIGRDTEISSDPLGISFLRSALPARGSVSLQSFPNLLGDPHCRRRTDPERYVDILHAKSEATPRIEVTRPSVQTPPCFSEIPFPRQNRILRSTARLIPDITEYRARIIPRSAAMMDTAECFERDRGICAS